MCMELITKVQDKSDRTEKGNKQIKITFGGLNTSFLVIDRINRHTEMRAQSAEQYRHADST